MLSLSNIPFCMGFGWNQTHLINDRMCWWALLSQLAMISSLIVFEVYGISYNCWYVGV